MPRVALLGGGGFIGCHVTRAFLDAGWDVVAGCRATSDRSRLDIPSARLRILDFDVTAADRSAIWDLHPDVVVNACGYGVNPRETDIGAALAVNATAVASLVAHAAARGTGRFIHIGSAAEYGPHATPVDEEASPAITGTYATTKLAGTLIALQAAQAARLDLCVVRPFGCYGPGESAAKFIPDLLAALRAGRPIDLTPGTQIRDYCFVADVAAAVLGLTRHEAGVAGRIFNICSGAPLAIRALGEALIAAAGADPALARWGARPSRPGENPYLVGNPARLAGLTGWRPRTSLAEGLRRTLMPLGAT